MMRTALLLAMLCMTCQQARKTSETSIWADVSEPLRGTRLVALPANDDASRDDRPDSDPIRPCHEYVPPWHVFLSVCAFIAAGFIIFVIRCKHWSTALIAFALIFDAGLLLLMGHAYYCPGENPNHGQYPHPGHYRAVEQAGSNSYLWIELPVVAVECPAGRVCL